MPKSNEEWVDNAPFDNFCDKHWCETNHNALEKVLAAKDTEHEREREDIRHRLDVAVAEECNLARADGFPTSRLTSLAMKLHAVLGKKNK